MAGQKLEGEYVLEIPRQIEPIPDAVLHEADRLGIKLRDVYGTEYRKSVPPPEN
jgi:hypothetical protein